ncbi:ferrous iron transport protein B [uncultured Clostridium sp.]|uniref:ferrous iron transport protein B n=1 Tax=uncultured Clostridium sp. TaxID=59620 RepID=UPI0025D8A430|nr:ferrous iron transport protein B [uncultured Clostridium sp.]
MGLTKNSTGLKILSSDKNVNNVVADYEIGLAGNPNVGKSTVFNALTGLNQHTGNWPGKTVANAEGYYEYRDNIIKVVDLPGTYSLLSNSEEEEIARDYICFNEPDLMVVVADATSLERNLNLFFQISEITDNVILCINLIDEANKKGIVIDKEFLEKDIGAPIVLTSARQNIGIEQLKSKIDRNLRRENKLSSKAIVYSKKIEEKVKETEEIIKYETNVDKRKERWIALRLLEKNEGIVKSIVKEYAIESDVLEKIDLIRNQEKGIDDEIIKTLVKTAEVIANKCVKQKKNKDMISIKIDKILVSKSTGIPIMILLLLFILWITISLANYPSELLSNLFSKIEEWLRMMFSYVDAPNWFKGVCIDGIYTTVSWIVAVMLPPMAIFFPLFTLLEDLGYLPRIAFNLDRCFKRCCSCGKQALTMCMGLGCNAAGVIGCRIINSPRERLLAIITNVFIPCNGRFPTLITISTIFIGGEVIGGIKGSLFSAMAVTIVIILGVLVTLAVTKILSKTLLKGINSSFVLELPPYRKPQILKVIVRSICDRTLYVLGRAVAIAIPAGIILWIFANITVGDGTLLSLCASFLDPFAKLIGLDGYILMAFILGLPANEIVIPIIIMSYLKTTTMMEMNNLLELKELLVANGWTILTAINMMLLCLLHYPCATTLWTIKKETNSVKWTVVSFLIPTVVGIVICFCTTQIWRLFA